MGGGLLLGHADAKNMTRPAFFCAAFSGLLLPLGVRVVRGRVERRFR